VGAENPNLTLISQNGQKFALSEAGQFQSRQTKTSSICLPDNELAIISIFGTWRA
jgi:hypothetical protein